MAVSRPANEPAFPRRLSQPMGAGRSVVAEYPFDGSVVANPQQSTAASAAHEARDRTAELAGGRTSDADGFQPEGEDTQAVEGVGPEPRNADAAIHTQAAAGIDLRRLRPVDLVRLLNGTDLGRVISERQLYRHRKRAGPQIHVGRRIDLYSYIGWLMVQSRMQNQERSLACYITVVEGGRMRLGRTKRPSTTSVTAHEVVRLLEDRDYRCALSGRELAPETAALDHVMPIARGGRHNIGNAQILHKDVNRAKGTLMNSQFIELCREVVDHADRKNAHNGDEEHA